MWPAALRIFVSYACSLSSGWLWSAFLFLYSLLYSSDSCSKSYFTLYDSFWISKPAASSSMECTLKAVPWTTALCCYWFHHITKCRPASSYLCGNIKFNYMRIISEHSLCLTTHFFDLRKCMSLVLIIYFLQYLTSLSHFHLCVLVCDYECM